MRQLAELLNFTEGNKMAKTTNELTIINVETGEETKRPLTADELAIVESTKIETIKVEAEKIAKAKAKADLLDKLGITAEEAALLLG